MEIVEQETYGDAGVLRVVQTPEPAAASGVVRVRVAARAVNPVDLATRSGAMAGGSPLGAPIVLGWDLAGTALDDGPGITAGQRVLGMVPWFATGTGRGSYAEVVAAEPGWLALLPDEVRFTQAAGVGVNALTAEQGLDDLAVGAGDTLLVTGASGGVGGAAVQLAVARGAHVVALASTGDEEHVASLGAKDVVPRGSSEEVLAAVRALLPGGVDAVFDAIGLAEGLAVVRDGGRFATAVGSSLPTAERGVTVTAIGVTPDHDQLVAIAGALAAGTLTARIVDELPLAQAAEAHRRLEAGGLRGKIVLTS